jgi:hypothetical protein
MKDGFRIELMCWTVPGPMGTPSRSRAHLGLTHLCIQVDDVDAVARRLASYGATTLERTRTEVHKETEDIIMLCVAVLDGLRIELLQRTARDELTRAGLPRFRRWPDLGRLEEGLDLSRAPAVGRRGSPVRRRSFRPAAGSVGRTLRSLRPGSRGAWPCPAASGCG